MLIDCDTCAARGPACRDCVVTVLLGVPAVPEKGGVELDGAEQAALAVLAGSGLVPPLRLRPSGQADDERRTAARNVTDPAPSPHPAPGRRAAG